MMTTAAMPSATFPQRPTLLALVAGPGEEVLLGGTLVISAWRGARTALLTMRGAQQAALHEAAARGAALLGVESHFHWNLPQTLEAGAAADAAARIARMMRALQPTLLLATPAAQLLAAQAWQHAADPTRRMPGLPLWGNAEARLWVTATGSTVEGDDVARINVSAARALVRATYFYYHPLADEADVPAHDWESFVLERGPAPHRLPTHDLWAGMAHAPSRPAPTRRSA